MTLYELPPTLVRFQLQSGMSLEQHVQGTSPVAQPISDIASLQNTWQQRYQDALHANDTELQSRAKSVLKLLADVSNDLVLLIWPRFKLTALLCSRSETFYVMDNTNDLQ